MQQQRAKPHNIIKVADAADRGDSEEDQNPLEIIEFQERPSRKTFQKVAAKQSDQCDHITGSSILSSTATGVHQRYVPPQKLTSLHSDYMLVSGSKTPQKDFIGHGRQSRNKMIDAQKSGTFDGSKQALKTMPSHPFAAAQNTFTDRNFYSKSNAGIEANPMDAINGSKGQSSAQKDSQLSASITKASMISSSAHNSNLKEAKTERDILAISKQKSKRLGDYLQPVLIKGASSAQRTLGVATLASNSKNLYPTSRGHRLFQKVAQSQNSGVIPADAALLPNSHKASKVNGQASLTATSRQVISVKQTIQKGIQQKSGNALGSSSHVSSNAKNAQQPTCATALSPMSKFLVPRYSQTSVTASVSNFKKHSQQSNDMPGTIPIATDYSKQKENKKIPPFKQMQTVHHSYNKTCSEHGLTKNEQHHHNAVKQVSQVLQIQRQKLQSLLDQSPQQPPTNAMSSAAKASRQQDSGILLASSQKGTGAQKRAQNVTTKSSKNPFKSPPTFSTKGGLITQRQPQQCNSSFTKGAKTLKASNSMIVSMINNTLRHTTAGLPVPAQASQASKESNRQRTFSQQKERQAHTLKGNISQTQHNQRKRMKNSQSQSMQQFMISPTYQLKKQRDSRSASRSKKERLHLKVIPSSKDLGAQTRENDLGVLRTLSQNQLQGEIAQTILTPKLKYILDDFKEEDISLKHPYDRSQKPISIGLTQPGQLSKHRTPLGMQGNASAKNSPSRSQPVLYLDLAASREIGHSKKSHDGETTVPNAREEGRIIEARLGDQKLASLISEQERCSDDTDASLKRLKSEPTLIKAAKGQIMKKSSSPNTTAFKKDGNLGKYSSPSRTAGTIKYQQSQSLKQMQINSFKKLTGQKSSKLSSKRTSIVQQSHSQVPTNDGGANFSSHLVGIDSLQTKSSSNVVLGNAHQVQDPPSVHHQINKLSLAHHSSHLGRNMTNPHGPKSQKQALKQGKKSPKVAQFYLSDTKPATQQPQSQPVQQNQQTNSAATMVLAGGTKNKMLLPPSLTGGVPKFVGGYPKSATGMQPYGSAAVTRPPAASTASMAKRRKVTDVSFLKGGAGVRGPPRTQGGARSISKNKTSVGNTSMAAISATQASGPLEAHYGSNQAIVETIVVDPQRQIQAEKAFLKMLVQVEAQKPTSNQQSSKREKSRERSSMRGDHSAVRVRGTTNQYNSKIVGSDGGLSNRPSVEQARKQMLDQMQLMQKKQDGSEYNASNLTQITDYRMGKHLGQGAYASVKQALHSETGFVLAIKVYEKFNLMEPQRKKSVAREINILRKLQHRNIMRLYDVIDTPRQLYLVMEYIQGTQLNNYLQSLPSKHPNYQLPIADPMTKQSVPKKKTSEQVQQSMLISQQLGAINTGTVSNEVAAKITVQVLQGLAYMHARSIYHRDIKPENVIYNPATGAVKIIDFGFACISKDKLRVFCGTPSYMSPEIVSKREYDGAASDVWASGVMLFAMLTGSVPFRAQSEKELFRKITKGAYSYTLQTYAQMVQSKQTYTSQIGTFDTSINQSVANYRQQSGVSSAAGNLNYVGNQDGKSTPTLPPQQIQVSSEVKTLIRNLLTVDEAQRPSAFEILLCSEWLQNQMNPHEVEQLQESAAQLEI